MKFFLITGLICVFIFSSSCNRKLIPISVLIPADTVIPADIKSISILPLAGTHERMGRLDEIKNIPLHGSYDYNEAKRGFVFGIYDILASSPRFNHVVLSDSGFLKNLNHGVITIEQLAEICRSDSTDAVLLIKSIHITDQFNEVYDVVHQADESEKNNVYNDYLVLNNVKWAIYMPSESYEVISNIYSDTLFIENKIQSSTQSLRFLYNLCFFAGSEIGRFITPSWNEQQRTLLKGFNTDLKTSVVLASKGRWDDAASIWNELSESRNRWLASKASYNLAVAWEQTDSIEQSVLWLDYAISLKPKKIYDSYRTILQKRQEDKKKIDFQLQNY